MYICMYHMIYSIFHESLEMLLSVTHRIRCGGADLCLEAAGGPTSPTYFEEGSKGRERHLGIGDLLNASYLIVLKWYRFHNSLLLFVNFIANPRRSPV